METKGNHKFKVPFVQKVLGKLGEGHSKESGIFYQGNFRVNSENESGLERKETPLFSARDLLRLRICSLVSEWERTDVDRKANHPFGNSYYTDMSGYSPVYVFKCI